MGKNRFVGFGALMAVTVGCQQTVFTSSQALAQSRPHAQMNQTDFVVRVVQFACPHEFCKAKGTNNANLGSPGVRATIAEMCHAPAREEWIAEEVDCFNKALPAVDPNGLNVWNSCKSLNSSTSDFDTEHNRMAIECFRTSYKRAIAGGSDVPIVEIGSGGSVIDAPGAAPLTAATPISAVVAPSAPMATSTSGITIPHLVAAQVVPAALSKGVIVIEIHSGTPAYNAGLRRGDVITFVNGVSIAGISEWRRAHADAGLGGTMRAEIVRTRGPKKIEWPVTKCEGAGCDCTAHDFCIKRGDTYARVDFEGLGLDGNRVVRVNDGAARAAGILKEDRIFFVDGQRLTDVFRLWEILSRLEKGDVAKVVVSRGADDITLDVMPTYGP